jgi:hypothetical protein
MRVQMAEAMEARGASDAAQRAAQEMLESRQALAAENVELEERLLAMKNEQLHGQQCASVWESRVAAAEAAVKIAEGKTLAIAAKKDKECARLEARLQVHFTVHLAFF